MKKMCIIIFILITISSINADNQGAIIVNIAGDDCVLDFLEGWNLFSFCKNLNNNDLNQILSPIQGKYRYIMKWNLTTQSFEIYSPQATQNPFTILDDNVSFFIYMYEPALLEIPGQNPSIEKRYLIEGWNTPAYQYSFSTTITNMFQGITDKLRYIMKWNSRNQEFEIYSPQAASNPFNQINKKEGRFIYMKEPSSIDY